jgi:hypothetical protein
MSRFAVDRFSRWIILAGVLFNVFTLSVTASSEYQQALYGEWGTETQCSRELITPQGTRRAAPFDIQRDWLEQGDVWCQLIWRKVSATDDGLFGLASALCGEDTGRSYDLRFRLSGDQLTLVWGLWHKNGPLERCEG